MKAITILSVITLMASAASAKTLPVQKMETGPTLVKPVSQVFNSVRVHRQGRGATVAWSTEANSSMVSSFTIMRTYDDPTDPSAEWTIVNILSCSNGRNYRCTDQSVQPGFISYKVIAALTNFNTEESEIVTLRIVQH